LRILHITPHLPPDQAANALLPDQLGRQAEAEGHDVAFVAQPPRAGDPKTAAGKVTWVTLGTRSRVARTLGIPSLGRARRVARTVTPLIASADLVHLHSNGLLTEVSAHVAAQRGLPTVLTLYGTEIWHYRRRFAVDLFQRMYRSAAHVTFYSQRLRDRASELGLRREHASVVYPPVPARFTPASESERARIRTELGIRRSRLILNVKRLHPLAGQEYLIEAMREVAPAHPDAALVICGTGPLREELEALARRAGVADRVTFTGLVDNTVIANYARAADLFVLPSILEAMPTVAVEALACGAPVVSADHPGGLELKELFADDVTIVPRRDCAALADAIGDRLWTGRRASERSAAVVEREFRPDAIWARFRTIYEKVVGQA
jgi:glycosyltransferase involved in cell wall biosynthesis